MKKIKVLLLAVCLFGATAHMKAQKQQYVKFTSIPEDATASQKGSMLKKAMKGEQIPGASVRASADSYTAVFGQDTYDKVMKAKNLIIGPAKGGEKNFAIGPNGPEQSGTLKEGTEIISLPDGTPVAKVGTNFCFNALLPADAIAADDGEDEDNQTVVKKDKTKTTNTGAPTIINVGTQGNQQELTWSAGYAVYSTGRNDRQNDFVVDAALYKMIQDSKQCCTGGGTANVVGTPTLYSATTPVATGAQQVAYVQKQSVPFGQTFIGQTLANGTGYALGTYTVRGIDALAGRIASNNGYRYLYTPTTTQSGDFEPSNQQGNYDNTWRLGNGN